jgi:hypothetical protein
MTITLPVKIRGASPGALDGNFDLDGKARSILRSIHKFAIFLVYG